MKGGMEGGLSTEQGIPVKSYPLITCSRGGGQGGGGRKRGGDVAEDHVIVVGGSGSRGVGSDSDGDGDGWLVVMVGVVAVMLILILFAKSLWSLLLLLSFPLLYISMVFCQSLIRLVVSVAGIVSLFYSLFHESLSQ